MTVKLDTKQILTRGGVGVLATDTLYGLVGRAQDKAAVERIYRLKRRRPDKPFIILIAKQADLEAFGIKPDPNLEQQLKNYWPGPVSIVLSCKTEEYKYLHRGTKTLAFRMPDKPELRELISITGPLVAPSANPEGQPPAESIEQARGYFGDQVDFYQAGVIIGKASRLIAIKDGEVTVLRT